MQCSNKERTLISDNFKFSADPVHVHGSVTRISPEKRNKNGNILIHARRQCAPSFNLENMF